MKKMLVAFMALSFVVGCSKDDDPAPEPPAANNSYQPLTVGSSWTYKTENKIAATEVSSTLTATSKDSTINAKSYKIFSNTGGANEYYYNSGNDYYQFGGIANITAPTELLYLKSDVAVGAGWDETKDVTIPSLGAANLKVSYSVVEKLDTYTVEGKAYPNVIHIKLTLSNITLSGLPVPVMSQDIQFYYALGVGRIKQQVKLNITGISPVDTESSLTAYTIVP